MCNVSTHGACVCVCVRVCSGRNLIAVSGCCPTEKILPVSFNLLSFFSPMGSNQQALDAQWLKGAFSSSSSSSFIHFLCPTGGKVEEMTALGLSPELCSSAVRLSSGGRSSSAVSPFLVSPQSSLRCRETKNETAATCAGQEPANPRHFSLIWHRPSVK